MPDFTLGLGDAIHKARRDRKLTQSELGARVGISQTHVSNIENGRSLDGHAIDRLCKELELDMGALLARGLGAITPVETEIRSDPRLHADDRELLIAMYTFMLARGPFGPGPTD